jgi:hypothetical protein
MKAYDPSASPAALAANWRKVLAVDALMGVAVAVAGLVLMAVWSPLGGAVLAALGVLYVFAVVRRYHLFKERRAEAGLDD